MQAKTLIPSTQQPVFIIGAGGIVNAAHLPAYQLANYAVHGIYDIDHGKAAETAKKFGVPCIFKSLEEMIDNAPGNAIYDVAVPGSELLSVLDKLPSGSAVLLQKPMGENLAAAHKI